MSRNEKHEYERVKRKTSKPIIYRVYSHSKGEQPIKNARADQQTEKLPSSRKLESLLYNIKDLVKVEQGELWQKAGHVPANAQLRAYIQNVCCKLDIIPAKLINIIF